jgi:hypothetical protein
MNYLRAGAFAESDPNSFINSEISSSPPSSFHLPAPCPRFHQTCTRTSSRHSSRARCPWTLHQTSVVDAKRSEGHTHAGRAHRGAEVVAQRAQNPSQLRSNTSGRRARRKSPRLQRGRRDAQVVANTTHMSYVLDVLTCWLHAYVDVYADQVNFEPVPESELQTLVE